MMIFPSGYDRRKGERQSRQTSTGVLATHRPSVFNLLLNTHILSRENTIGLQDV